MAGNEVFYYQVIYKVLSTFYQVLIHFCAFEAWLLTSLSLFGANFGKRKYKERG